MPAIILFFDIMLWAKYNAKGYSIYKKPETNWKFSDDSYKLVE